MRKSILGILIAASLIFGAVPAFGQRVYYVQSMRAKITSNPSFKARTIAVVKKGYPLTVLGRKGTWIKVKYGNKQGYVPSLLLSRRPPLNKRGLIKADEDALKSNIRRRASTYTSAAAARGLAADDRRRLSAEGEIDLGSLEKMEAFTVSVDELSKFQAGGRL